MELTFGDPNRDLIGMLLTSTEPSHLEIVRKPLVLSLLRSRGGQDKCHDPRKPLKPLHRYLAMSVSKTIGSAIVDLLVSLTAG